MTIAIVLLVIVGIVVIALYLLTQYAFNQITRMQKVSPDECLQRLEQEGLYSKERFDGLLQERIGLKSSDGLRLHGIFIEPYPESKRVVILIHGYTVAYAWMMQFAEMYIKLGFNVLLYDQRRHGSSEGMYSTYGYLEKQDLDLWIGWVVERKGDDCIIGLHGQSMGGGTVLEYAGMRRYEQQVKFVIADCPYSDLTELMEHQVRNLNRIPTFPLLNFIDWMVHARAGFRLRDVSPIRSIQKSKWPILFIHGAKDNFVPTHMSKALYQVKRPGINKLLIIEGAAHAVSYGTDKERYEREVAQFIEEVL